MSILHRHQWQTTEEHYTPPAHEGTAKNMDEESFLYFSFGITVAKQECDYCGLVAYVRTPGRGAR